MARRRQLLVTDWLASTTRAVEPSRDSSRAPRGSSAADAIVLDDGDGAAVLESAGAGPPQWPDNVGRLHGCLNPNCVVFRDELGDLGACTCSGACVRGACANATAGIYCDRDNCGVGSFCGNRLDELACLFLTLSRLGLGVATSVPLPPETAVGEYCGVIRTSADFTQVMRQSGYGFEFAETSSAGERVYVDASQQGSLCRFLNHSCVANCRFEVMLNREKRKVAVVTSEQVPVSGELTLTYCSRLWFACSCAACVCSRADA